MTDESVAIVVLLVVCCVLFAWALRASSDWRAASRKLMRMQFANPYAHLLGKTVEAKVYEASEWERMVVVAVSWRGAVCVRPEHDLGTIGRWIKKDLTPTRVREVQHD